MTEKIEVIEIDDILGNPKKHVIIRREDGSFLSYTKEYYDELQTQAEQSTPMMPGDE